MRYYFSLQYRMLNSHLAGFGINPALAYVLALASFIGFSVILFSKTEFATYIYIFTALSLVMRLSETRRNQFLKTCFPDTDYFKVRIFENSIITFPFIIFLAFKMLFVSVMIVAALSIILSFINYSNKASFTIPTPFGKRPFEFTVGFRNTVFVFFLAYFLMFISVWVENFNLGVFSLLLIFLVCMTFYFNPENEFYVWIFNQRPGKFILGKITIALLYSTCLSLPVSIALWIFFPDKFLVIAGFQALGYLYLSTIILAKYSSFPHQINLPQFVIMAVSVWFPPLLIAVIPFFYRQSVKRLNEILA